MRLKSVEKTREKKEKGSLRVYPIPNILSLDTTESEQEVKEEEEYEEVMNGKMG